MIGDESNQLRRSAAEACGCGALVERARGHVVKGLGEERGEVLVSGVARDAGVTTPLTPERAAGVPPLISFRDDAPKFDGEREAESPESGLAVGLGASVFVGVGGHAGRDMGDPDECLDFVSMLPAGASGAATSPLAMPHELIDGPRGRMRVVARGVLVLERSRMAHGRASASGRWDGCEGEIGANPCAKKRERKPGDHGGVIDTELHRREVQ